MAKQFLAELVERGLNQLVLSCMSKSWHSDIGESISCPQCQARSSCVVLSVLPLLSQEVDQIL